MARIFVSFVHEDEKLASAVQDLLQTELVLWHHRLRLARNRGGVKSGETTLRPQKDYGRQNLDMAVHSYLESPKILASREDCIERAAQHQTSGIRAALSPFAMMDLIAAFPKPMGSIPCSTVAQINGS